jgi:hypothetical protein
MRRVGYFFFACSLPSVHRQSSPAPRSMRTDGNRRGVTGASLSMMFAAARNCDTGHHWPGPVAVIFWRRGGRSREHCRPRQVRSIRPIRQARIRDVQLFRGTVAATWDMHSR